MKQLNLVLWCVVSGFFSGVLQASTCTDQVQNLVKSQPLSLRDLEKTLKELSAKEANLSPRLATLESYERLTKNDAELEKLLSPDEIAEILANPESTYAPEMLAQLLTRYEGAKTGSAKEKIQSALDELLQDKVPASSIKSRIDNFLARKSDDALMRALGDMSFEETKELYHGGNPLKPSSDSLIGKYLSETGASTTVKAFPLTPGGTELGPERLVVSVSESAFASYQKYFKRHDSLSVIGHAYVIHDGKLSSYIHKGVDMRLPSVGNTLPTVLLKTSEADRTTQYLRVMTSMQGGGYSWDSVAMQPWKLDGYCAVGAYVNCTHWIGNMPIGDRLVDEYSFPGAMDTYAQNHLATNDAAPRVAKLAPYKSDDVLLKRVFKVPGHEQFADVIGQHDANMRGDFANPGWVIHTLLGPTSSDRVPVVFLVTPDHKAPIDPKFVPQFERPI